MEPEKIVQFTLMRDTGTKIRDYLFWETDIPALPMPQVTNMLPEEVIQLLPNQGIALDFIHLSSLIFYVERYLIEYHDIRMDALVRLHPDVDFTKPVLVTYPAV